MIYKKTNINYLCSDNNYFHNIDPSNYKFYSNYFENPNYLKHYLKTNYYKNNYKKKYLSKRYSYSPNLCTPVEYKFTFIFDQNEKVFKVHGIWPDKCKECLDCDYPTCCDISKLEYTYPNDPTNFIQNKWFNSTAHEDCSDNRKVMLFEHEYWKHVSCSNMKTTDEFLSKAIELYDKYYDEYVEKKCENYKQIWLNLDENFNLINTTCVN